MDERKWWDWSHGSVRQESDIITSVFEKGQQTKVTANQNKEPSEHNFKRSTRVITDSTRLAGYERFPNQAIDADFLIQ